MKYEVNPEVRRIIARMNLSEREIARRAGISSAHLSLVLRGKRTIGPTVRAALTDVLCLNFDDLFHEVAE